YALVEYSRHAVTVFESRSTVATCVAPVLLSNRVIAARRGSPAAGFHPSTSDLVGSSSCTCVNRACGPSLFSVLNISDASVTSASLSGSSGWPASRPAEGFVRISDQIPELWLQPRATAGPAS